MKDDLTAREMFAKLEGYTGTEGYHRNTILSLLNTDGIQALCEMAECFWLVTAVSSYQSRLKRMGESVFQIWELAPCGNNGALLTCRRDKGSVPLVSQVIELTNFPFDDWKTFRFYVCENVMMLVGEY